jgi:amino acid adenylation domain-containing protein
MSIPKLVSDRILILHEAFESQVEKTPEAIAVEFDGEQLTYSELNQKANQIAHYLCSLNVSPEMLVGIYLDRSIEMVVGMLGIFKAGAAFVPLDPSQPQERLAFMLADTKIEILVTLKKLVAGISEHPKHLVCLDAEEESISAKSNSNPVSGVQPKNLAYTIYTSGSTGQPKGVMVPHQAICQGFLWMQENFPIMPQDRILQKLPLTFDFSFWELFWPLMNGACVILAKPGGEKDINYLVKLIARQEISVLVFVPSVLQVILSENGLENCSHIRMVFTGGEPLTSALKEQFFKRLPSCQLYDLFGGTENIIITYWHCQADEPASRFPIGHVFPDLSIYIVDEQLCPVPSGEQGELLVGGWGLARGYLNRPELTAQKFILNPFNPNSGERLYRTGDLVRRRSDGTLEILGRIDHQVKIRGFRIELGEIESALTQHPDVREAIVIVREDKPNDKRLVAYLSGNITSNYIPAMRTHLKGKLPDYMMPSAIVLVDAMPLTPNGKIDRRALPAPDLSTTDTSQHYVAPQTLIEKTVTKIWAEVLGLERVSTDEFFLDLGGHSLLAVQIINQIRDTLAVELPIKSLFENPTIAKLAKLISVEQQNGLFHKNFAIQPVLRDKLLPLTWQQQSLWFLSQLEPDNSVYNEPFTIYFPSKIEVDLLERAINELIKRHESLRSRFITVDGQPMQMIDPPIAFHLPVVDLRHYPIEQRESEAIRLATLEARQLLDMESGSLFRATLMQLADEKYRLFFTVHHIIIDGISIIEVLLPELEILYQTFSHNNPIILPELPIQPADFAVWQHQYLTEEALAQQLDYWQQHLSGDLPILQLPTDFPPPIKPTFQGAQHSLTLSSELTEALKLLAHQKNVTLFMTLLAAFKALLYRYTGQEDLLIATVSAGRNRSEIGKQIGYFLNTLVLRTDLSGSPSFRELLIRVKEIILRASACEEVPFTKLVEVLQPDRNLNQNPLFQVAFVLEPAMPIFESGWKVSYRDVHTKTAKFDLSIEIDLLPEGMIAHWEYNTDLFEADTIERMSEHFQTLLQGIVANSEQRISDLPVLSEAQTHQLLFEWNQTQADYPQDKCIHQLFEEQVERYPDAIAVVFEEQQLTYSELNTKANQLAHYLQDLGVQAETLVGICVERSLEMIIGILGILKAGGAYVPLDPDYPQERLSLIIEDANVSLILTQSQLIDRLPIHRSRLVYLDKEWQEIARQSGENLTHNVKSSNLAYVIYTSGSTGKPKGVLIEHKSLVNYTLAAIAKYDINDCDRILQFTSLNFDVSAEEIYTCLVTGASIVLRTELMLASSQTFLQKCQEWGITVAILPTAYWHDLTGKLESDRLSLPPALKLVVVGGERVLATKVEQWQRYVGKQVKLINAYGPTEATISALWCDLSALNLTVPLSEVPIGRSIPNTQVYILDRYLQPVPIGVAGELYIGGDGLARGYLNRPDLTAEKFIPNPFNSTALTASSNDSNSRLYKTGDLARYLPDANIEFRGRIDHQVKIRGFRIELGEIESALSQHPDVREAIVVVREDKPSDKRLVAYLTSNLIPDRLPYQSECLLELNGNTFKLQTADISSGGVGVVATPMMTEGTFIRLRLLLPGSSETQWFDGQIAWSKSAAAGIKLYLTPAEQVIFNRSITHLQENQGLWKTWQRTIANSLRNYLKGKLPDYMMPNAFVLLDAMPLTPNGKIDRLALPALLCLGKELEDKFVLPRTHTEVKLAAIWAEVLGLEKVGINDNFFELGGSSLQAVSLVFKLSVDMNLNVLVKLLFSHPTIAELAQALDQFSTQNTSLDRGETQLVKLGQTTETSPIGTTDFTAFFKLEQQPLLSLFAVGKIAPVDAAALDYLPLSLLQDSDLTRNKILQDWFDNLPMWNTVTQTKWGRIAGLTLPIFEDELYSNPDKLVQMTVEALEMAGRIGAKTLSLTGLIPSATDYGRAIVKAIEGRNDLPAITTGHATTRSTLILTIKKILQVSNRSLEREKVAFIGLGAVGLNSLRLMLKCLPHPESLILYGVYSNLELFQNFQQEIIDELGFRGSIQIATSSSITELPSEIYDATLIIGTNNVPDIINIDRVMPKTLIINNSSSCCFSRKQAIERFEKQQDILFTEGGLLQSPHPIETVIYLPKGVKNSPVEASYKEYFVPNNSTHIAGCVLSSLLSARFDHLEPTRGSLKIETSVQYYQALEQLSFQGADLHCGDYVLQVDPK